MIKLIILILLWMPKAFGYLGYNNLPPQLEHSDSQTKFAYKFVMKYCNDWNLAFSQLTGGSLYELSETAVNFNDVGVSSRIRNAGKSIQLTNLLESMGYYIGLNDCFGDNQTAKDLFTLNIISGDLLGSASGAAIGALTWIGGSRLMKWIAAKVIPSNLIPKIRNGFYAIVGTATGGYVIINVYQRIKIHMEYLEAIQLESERKKMYLIEVKKDLNEFQALLDSGQLDEGDQIFASEFVEELKLRISKIEVELELH